MKTKKILLVSTILLLAFTLSLAHEFWLQPQKFLLKINEKINIDIFVGEDYKGENWSGTKDKIVKLTHYANGNAEDFMATVPENAPKNLSEVSFATEGNHLIAFNNKNKFIKLKAAKFNEYLNTEGLDLAAQIRKEKKLTAQEGREFYQRCVKTLLQVGNKQDDTFKQNTGMILELIPSINPYTPQANQIQTFTVLFENKLLVNGLVLIWHHNQGKTTIQKMRSNSSGQIQFKGTRKGRWMISVVHMVPHTTTNEADWQSYWSSYTYGFY